MFFLSFFNDNGSFFLLVYQDYCVFLQGKIKNAMKTTFRLFALGAVAAMAVGCTTHYQIAGVERSRILVNNRFDNEPNVQGTAFLAPYKAKVDEVKGRKREADRKEQLVHPGIKRSKGKWKK